MKYFIMHLVSEWTSCIYCILSVLLQARFPEVVQHVGILCTYDIWVCLRTICFLSHSCLFASALYVSISIV